MRQRERKKSDVNRRKEREKIANEITVAIAYLPNLTIRVFSKRKDYEIN